MAIHKLAWAVPLLLASAAPLVMVSCASRQHGPQTQAPASTMNLQRQVVNAADAGDGDAQTRALREQVVADPANLAARLALADRYWKAGTVELAIDHYRIAVERYPDNSAAAMLLARALRDRHRPEDAIAALTAYWGRNPAPPSGLLSLLGILQDDTGGFAAAEKAYRAAIAQTPARADVRNNLGYNLLLQRRFPEAVEQFQEALKIEPGSAPANNNLGLALLAQWTDDSQPKDALLHWQAVSGPATAHSNLASVLIEQHRLKEARRELEIALGYQKDHPAALANLKLLTEMGGPAGPVRSGRDSFWKRVKTVFSNQKSVSAQEMAGNLH